MEEDEDGEVDINRLTEKSFALLEEEWCIFIGLHICTHVT
jgi:hypothetical protein